MRRGDLTPTRDPVPAKYALSGRRSKVTVVKGVLRGTDAVKAIALGADAVLVGRPVLWGLTVGGADGVEAVLDLLRRELAMAMALCGVTRVGQIGTDLLD